MRLNTLILLFLSLACFQLSAQRSFSLQEAIDYALANSNQMKLAELDVIDAQASINETRSTGMPTLGGTVNYQHFVDIPGQVVPAEFFGGPPGEFGTVAFGLKNNLTASLNLNALLFDATFFTGLKAARLYRDLIQTQNNQVSRDLRYEVTSAYLLILIGQRNEEMLAKNIENLEQILAETRATYEEGFVEKLDVDRLDLSLKNLRTEEANVKRSIGLGYYVLKLQMNFPLEEEIIVTDEIDALLGTSLDDKTLEGEAFNVVNRPEYAVIKAGEALNQIQIDVIKKRNIPSLYGFGTHQQSLQRDNVFDGDQPGWIPGTIVGAQLNVPIFDGQVGKYQKQRAEIELKKTQIQLNTFETSAAFEYINALTNYVNAKNTVNGRKESLDLAEYIYDKTQIKYREGVGASIEVRQAETELYQAQADYVNGLYDLLVAKVDLEKALGK